VNPHSPIPHSSFLLERYNCNTPEHEHKHKHRHKHSTSSTQQDPIVDRKVMPSSLSFYGGWAGIAVVGAGYWYLQKRKATSRQAKVATQQQKQAAVKPTENKKDVKAKSQRTTTEGAQSSGDQADKDKDKASKKKSRKTAKPEAAPPAPAPAPSPKITPDTSASHNDGDGDGDGDDEIDNKEFARQLSNAKSGTTIGSRSQAGPRQKSVKQSRASAAPANSFDSAPSSNAGADADDDLSAAESPLLTATHARNVGGVADMLEAPTGGPSILRITSPTNPQPAKEKKAAKAPEPVETKKQRQNRKKKEAEKAAREAAEAERKVLQENQRRAAREAEGRAAKDGSQFTAAKVAAASVWKPAEAAPAPETRAATNGHVQLLDTYEPETKPAAAQPKPKAAKASNDYATLPSEEEQLRLIEEDAAWNTVTKAKKGKKKAEETAKPVETPPVERTPEPVPIKLPKKTVDVKWADAELGDRGATQYNIEDDEWEVA